MLKRIRIVLVDDQSLGRLTMAYFLNSTSDMEVVAEAADGEEGVEAARLHQPDVVVMDYFMPGLNGAQATAEIGLTAPHTRVIGTSHNNSQTVIDAMRKAGAVDFLAKHSSMPDLMDAIRRAAGQRKP
jgi:DNA-binding NarL/FixJ family response regulator